MPLTPTKQPSAGFTLIEVVIAVALFAMAATVLSSSFVNALLVREHSVSQQTLALDLAAVRKQLLLEPELAAAEEGADCITLNHGAARWHAEIETTDIVDLFQVELFIEFTDSEAAQGASHQATLYLLRPTWSKAEERSELLDEKRTALNDTRERDRF